MARDTRRAFAEATKAMEPAIRRAFLQAIADVRSVAQYRLVEAAIERGDIQGALDVLRLGSEFFAPLDRALDDVFRAGAAYQLGTLPKRMPTSGGGPLIVRFQGRNPRAEEAVRRIGGDLIQEILEDQRTLVVEAVRNGIEVGRGPRQTALDIVGRVGANGRRSGGLIGLHSKDARAVQRARDELAGGSADYFRRAGRDRRFDGTVRKAMREGRALSQADIDRIAGRYSDRLLKLRGDTIARTETIKAFGAGRYEGVAQLIDTGQVSARHVTLVWDATGDARTRPDHMTMEGQTVIFGFPFVFPDGSRALFPGDTSLGASAKQTIQCRCYVQIKIDWFAQAREAA